MLRGQCKLSLMLPRLIATDLDGTLLNRFGEGVTVHGCRIAGCPRSGRDHRLRDPGPPIVAFREVAAVGPAARYGVMANGSIICSLPDAEPMFTIGFPSTLAFEAIARRLRAHDPLFGFGWQPIAGSRRRSASLSACPSTT